MIRLDRRDAERDHAIEVFARGAAREHADQHVTVVGACVRVEPPQVGRLDIVEEARDRGLGQDDEPRPRTFRQAQVGVERAQIAPRIELERLLDVAL